MTFSQELSDPFVEYRLIITDGRNAADMLSGLMQTASQLMNRYVWHYEQIALEVNGPTTLQGRTYFRGAYDDEWFIVYILWQISIEYPDIVIACRDNDGQFLLIEAADELAEWMSPEASHGRVFIHNGELHIIPPFVLADTIEAALSTVLDESKLTLAPLNIQSRIIKRIDAFKAQQGVQIKCIVPRSIARILIENPQWISLAIEAFCERDILNTRVQKLPC